MDELKVYTVEQVAEMLSCSTASVLALLKEGRLKGFKIGERTYRITEEQLRDFIEKNPINL